MTNEDLNLYVIAELKYQKMHNNEKDIFPIDWYSSNNYKLKTEIIAEAIKNNLKIEETKLYQDSFLEGVKINIKKDF